MKNIFKPKEFYTMMGITREIMRHYVKSAVAGTTDHMVYYIQVDGKAYFGQNDTLDLDWPTPDNVFFQ